MNICDYGCGNEGKFYKKYAKKWCCSKSQNSCTGIKKKQHTIENLIARKQGVIDKYGVTNISQLDSVKQKKTDTLFKNYGVTCVMNIPEVRQKINIESKTSEAENKRKDTLIKRYGVDNIFKRTDIIRDSYLKHFGVEHPTKLQEVQDKKKQTNIKKYGGTAPSHNPEIKAKQKKTLLKNYGSDAYKINAQKGLRTKELRGLAIPRSDWSKRDLYYDEVKKFTDYSWINYYDEINPNNLIRGFEFTLDHKFSVHEGFKQNIDPKIIGHWTNLRMISRSENSKKKESCSISIEQLFEDYIKTFR